jgi:hypothetical protein
MLLLITAHAFMMHFNRPHDMITWVEGLINGAEGALIVLLSRPSSKELSDGQPK